MAKTTKTTTTKAEATTTQQSVAFRLDVTLLARLDAHAARMSAATPGVTFTRSDVVRVLLLQGLDTAEGARR